MEESASTSTKNSKIDVFISYASENVELATEVRRALTGAGITSFLATESNQDEVGSAGWLTSVNKALEDCKWLVVVATKEALASEWVAFEANHVFDSVKTGKKPNGSPIGLWYEGPEPREWMPTLQSTQAIDMREPLARSSGFEQLILRLKGSEEGDAVLLNAKIRSLSAAVDKVERAGIRQPWWERSGTVVLLAGIISGTVLMGFLASAYSQAKLGELTQKSTLEQQTSRALQEEISNLRRDALNTELAPGTRKETLIYLIPNLEDKDLEWAKELLDRMIDENNRLRLVETSKDFINYSDCLNHAENRSQYFGQEGTGEYIRSLLMTPKHNRNEAEVEMFSNCELNLSGRDLSYFYGPNALLSFASFAYSDFTSATLSGALLYQTNFQSATLAHSVMSNANLSESSLDNADLTHADLTHANLREATLIYADLSYANLTGADLRYANLTGVILTGTILEDVKWARTTCPDGSLSDMKEPEGCE